MLKRSVLSAALVVLSFIAGAIISRTSNSQTISIYGADCLPQSSCTSCNDETYATIGCPSGQACWSTICTGSGSIGQTCIHSGGTTPCYETNNQQLVTCKGCVGYSSTMICLSNQSCSAPGCSGSPVWKGAQWSHWANCF